METTREMSKELKELYDLLNREIETMRRTGRSDISYILCDAETEDASDEVLDMCQAARKAHEAAFIDWQKAHPAEWAAVLKKADEDMSARISADDYGAAIDAAYNEPF